MTERALSIRNPWAALIMSGNKLVENRTWTTKWRGTFAVHAGLTIDKFGLAAAAEFEIVPPFTGGYLGLVDLVDVHHGSDDCCGIWAETGACHWQLENPRLFTTPIPGPGRLALYVPSREIRDAIDAAHLEPAA